MLFVNNKINSKQYVKMERKNTIEANHRIFNCNKQRTIKYSSTKYFKTIASSSPPPSQVKCDNNNERLATSPVQMITSTPQQQQQQHQRAAAAVTINNNNNNNRSNRSQGNSPRTSPGLLAGHYAGCKFTEPPSPSALPLPPQHWTQQNHHQRSTIKDYIIDKQNKLDVSDIAHQLKVLLKVQA